MTLASVSSLFSLRRFVAFSTMLGGLALTASAPAQQTVVFPSTISTYAGSVPAAASVGVGKLCNGGGTPGTGNTLPVATDALNDGCPAAQGIFSPDIRGGVATDPQGNVYVFDGGNGGNNVLRKIDARSGIISLLVGGAATSPCAAAVDKHGDGCPYVNDGQFNNPRGLESDPYGNLVLADYGGSLIHLLCNALSPTCSSAQLGTMRVAAGCTTTVSASGSGGNGADNVLANPNVPGGCTTAYAELNTPRGASMDGFGNIFIADTADQRFRLVLGPQTYNGVTNPLWAILQLNPAYATLNAGYIYSMITKTNGTAPVAGNYCSGTSGPKFLSAAGDGCAFYKAQVESTSGSLQATAQDAAGDIFFYDYTNTSVVRVIYAGGPLAAAAITAYNSVTPVVGSVYVIAGGGSTAPSANPLSGKLANLSAQIYKMAIDPNTQNLYVSYSSSVLYDELATGFVRKIGSGGTNCAAAASATGATPDAQGDGCTALAANFGGSNGLGIALDNLGNLFIADTTNALVRKVSAGSYASVPAKSTYKPNYNVHSSLASGNTTVTLGPNADFTIAAGTCVANLPANSPAGDSTNDCPNVVTFVPSGIGLRSAPTLITPTTGTPIPASITGTGTGTALVVDTATPVTSALGALTGSTAVAVSGAGNVFTAGNNGSALTVNKIVAGVATSIYTPASLPTEIAVDPQGNVYLAYGTTAHVTKLTFTAPSTYTAADLTSVTATNTAFGSVTGIAVDANQNVYLENTAGAVLRYTQSSLQLVTLTATALNTVTGSNVTGISLDYNGNVLIADNGAGVIYKLPVAGIATGLPTTVKSGIKPISVVADPAGDIYYADTTANAVTMIPITGSNTTVVGSTATTTGLSIDGQANIYVSDTSLTGIEVVTRNATTFTFPNTSTTFAGTITNTGNVNATGYTAAGLDTTDFPVTSVSPTNCFSATPITPGLACSITVQFSPTSGTGTVTSVIQFAPAATTFGSLTLSGVKTGASVTTTTTIGTQTPANPIYSVSGTEVTFPVTVTASDASTPTGTISFQVGNMTPIVASLSGGTVSIPLSGLPAGMYSAVATYPNQNGLVGSTSTTVNFTIAQATTTVTWNPSTTTQAFSAAVGLGVLDATATSGGTAVAGNFIYTATPSGGTAAFIHSASFLSIGTYSLAVTFVPSDATDFSGGTASVPSYTVNKATTTAGLGASQTVVAADGSANYTTVQAAVNAVGATGGSVYIKPGTYNGFISVVQPNVALRGLGGDPTAVVLTHETGAFNNGQSQNAAVGDFAGVALNGSQLPTGSSAFTGDEGSATLVAAKGINTALGTTTLTPTNFYGENFTLANTYNTDNTTTTTTYQASSGGACTANQGPAMTYQTLFNGGVQCASQALAIWITADLSVMNNIYSTSVQDTIYAGSVGSNGSVYTPSRQYWFRGKVTGSVDYIFGDAAAVFDYSSIYTIPHGAGVSGSATIEAQNKANMTGSGNDYLSGYVMNSNIFTSYTTGMTGLEFGRPYGVYSTWIMLNSAIDQVNPAGYIPFSGANLPTSTYDEYNDLLYTDPATGSPDANGVIYQGLGGNSGAGVTGPRETTSLSPGTPMANNAVKTSMTQAQAQPYFPTNFLGTTVSSSPTPNFNPTSALATNVNAFATAGTVTSVVGGTSVTILMRPQTPGLGAITNGNYTIPTGSYVLRDTFNGATTTLASGQLDAAGEASYSTSTLTAGSHSLVWTYGGDSNFSGSTANAYAITVSGTSTTTVTSITTNPIVYGQSANVNVTVTPASGTVSPNGTATLTIDGSTTQTMALTNGTASFTVAGLTAGSHSLAASYSGSTTFVPSTASTVNLTVNQATLTVTAACANRVFGQVNSCSATVTGYQYTDTAATVFTATPTGTTTAMRNSVAGMYTATPANTGLTAFGSTNYTVTPVNGSFTISGGAAQAILFAPLPNFPQGGSYQLTARTTSGLPVSYTVTAGNATITGTTLTVNSAGTVTVQANQSTDPTGDYTAATPVSRSFTAQ